MKSMIVSLVAVLLVAAPALAQVLPDLHDVEREAHLDHELRDPHAPLDPERVTAVVDQDDTDLAPVSLVDRARRVEDRHRVVTSEAASRTDLGFGA